MTLCWVKRGTSEATLYSIWYDSICHLPLSVAKLNESIVDICIDVAFTCVYKKRVQALVKSTSFYTNGSFQLLNVRKFAEQDGQGK